MKRNEFEETDFRALASAVDTVSPSKLTSKQDSTYQKIKGSLLQRVRNLSLQGRQAPTAGISGAVRRECSLYRAFLHGATPFRTHCHPTSGNGLLSVCSGLTSRRLQLTSRMQVEVRLTFTRYPFQIPDIPSFSSSACLPAGGRTQPCCEAESFSAPQQHFKNLNSCSSILDTYQVHQWLFYAALQRHCESKPSSRCASAADVSYPCNRPWRPIGLWDVEDPIFSRPVVFNLFCSRTPRYNFSWTLYPQSCCCIIQVIYSL
jgi:hypothetical protein